MAIPGLDGWWINFEMGKAFLIDEHQRFMRAPGNARKLGVPAGVIRRFGPFRLAGNRNVFLPFVMARAPVMRVRQHREYVTFEYASRSDSAPMKAILAWCGEHAGPLTWLNIVNLKTNRAARITFQDFEAAMEAGGPASVLAAPARKGRTTGSVAAVV